jgi:predicted pyridoxine 5'-phosphate oxidase superfamily flavin-nucleotide-binding protein
MSTLYGPGARAFQDRFDARRLADRIQERLVRDHLDDGDRAFIEARDMCFLATVDAAGHASCSYKGGDPGFVRVLDERTLAFPSYDGNGMFVSLGALAETGELGMLFVDFEAPARLRVNGRARVAADDPLRASWPEAQLVVRVDVREVFPNCGRYIHRYTLAERSRFVPHAGCDTPVPGWKKSEWAADVLPEKK